MNSRLQLRQLRTAARWCWRRILFLLLSVVLPATGSALEIRRVQTCSGVVLRLRGDVRLGDFSQVKSQFRGKEAIIDSSTMTSIVPTITFSGQLQAMYRPCY
jgi:hypothetical protein